ncbi:MAG: site-2 protease family protein [Chloroflexi bacterium]|jgi:Zn-dependent protease|nr:site-2 protease family protein [Chloroflexota bacterium]
MLIIFLFYRETLIDDPLGFMATLIPMYLFFLLLLIPMMVFHEISHGMVALKLGDDTAKMMGRLSWNPLVHLDRAGTLMFLIVGIGRAKPVPINPYCLNMDPRKGMAIVAAAGPLSNFLVAILCAALFRLDILSLPSTTQAQFADLPADVILTVLRINVLLAVFNMFPVPPFDGFRIAVGMLPDEQARSLASIERYAPQIIMIFFIAVLFTGFLWTLLDFVTNAFLGQNYF